MEDQLESQELSENEVVIGMFDDLLGRKDIKRKSTSRNDDGGGLFPITH